MPPVALTSLNTAFTALRSVMPSSPTGPLSMKKPPSLMLSAVTPMSVAPPLPAAGPGARVPEADAPGAEPAPFLAPPAEGPAAAERAADRPPDAAAAGAALAPDAPPADA